MRTGPGFARGHDPHPVETSYYVRVNWGGSSSSFGIVARPYTLHIEGPPPADLVIENVTFTPAAVNVGNSFVVNFAVRNHGPGPVNPTQARLRLSADRILTRYDWPLSPLDVNIPAISAGQSYQFSSTVSVPAGTPQGQYYVGAFADWDDSAGQSDISNDAGVSATQLTVNAPGVQPPVITAHPQGGTIRAGESVMFRVAASGIAPLTYQWKRDGFLDAHETASAQHQLRYRSRH